MKSENTKKPAVRKKSPGKLSRRRILAYITRCLCFAAVLTLCFGVYISAKPGLDYKRALRLGRAGDFDGALAALSKLEDKGYDEEKLEAGYEALVEKAVENGGYDLADSLNVQVKDTEKRKEYSARILYGRAEEYSAGGLYADAARTFYEVYGYLDGEEKYYINRCAGALETYYSGNEAEGIRQLLSVPNPENYIYAAAVLVTGSGQKAAEIRDSGLFTRESLSAR